MSSLSPATRKVLAEGACRCCGATLDLTRHHLVPQRWFAVRPGAHGRQSPHNIVPLCVYCHRVLDDNRPDLAEQSREKRRALRGLLTPDEVRFVVRLCGTLWLDENYPPFTVYHDTRDKREWLDRLPYRVQDPALVRS